MEEKEDRSFKNNDYLAYHLRFLLETLYEKSIGKTNMSYFIEIGYQKELGAAIALAEANHLVKVYSGRNLTAEKTFLEDLSAGNEVEFEGEEEVQILPGGMDWLEKLNQREVMDRHNERIYLFTKIIAIATFFNVAITLASYWFPNGL